MCYKTILVHADLAAAADERLRLAARLARTFAAHLVGAAATGVSRFVPPQVLAHGGPALATCCAALRADAREALERFERVARAEDVASFEARLVDDDIDGGLALQARYADLAIVGQPEHGIVAPPASGDLPAQLLLHAGRPLLVLPRAGRHAGLDGAALVAWDGSTAATRAVTAALPLLRRARAVTVLHVEAHGPAPRIDDDPCLALAGWLARHGIRTHAAHAGAPHGVGAALLAHIARDDAGLLVMGAYGRPRLRERLLDGTTEALLRATTVPTLLAH
ncbi:universal stress protein [uncultured Massilia sp.]|uniref:universal stress protein n=1 Tax=uncultured Massilia sp. TaxID=169973 RepID=UPI0025DA155B|nr:universal stress protein [uncultured Massilia sp.]